MTQTRIISHWSHWVQRPGFVGTIIGNLLLALFSVLLIQSSWASPNGDETVAEPPLPAPALLELHCYEQLLTLFTQKPKKTAFLYKGPIPKGSLRLESQLSKHFMKEYYLNFSIDGRRGPNLEIFPQDPLADGSSVIPGQCRPLPGTDPDHPLQESPETAHARETNLDLKNSQFEATLFSESLVNCNVFNLAQSKSVKLTRENPINMLQLSYHRGWLGRKVLMTCELELTFPSVGSGSP